MAQTNAMADSKPPKEPVADSDDPAEDNQFNRITLSSVLKTQLMQDIAESTESLPNWRQRQHAGFDEDSDADDEGDGAARAADATAASGKASAAAAAADAKQVPSGDDALIGVDLTAEKTVTQAEDDHESGKKGRPGALRRLTTRIRKTMSGSQGKEGKNQG